MLTTREYDAAEPKTAIYRLKDSPNLFLVIYPSGRKSWEYRYQIGGTSKALILGEYGGRKPALGPKAARIRRDSFATDRNSGIDPVLAKKLKTEQLRAELETAKVDKAKRTADREAARLAATRDAVTVQTVAEKWIESNRPHWSRDHAHQCEQSLTDHAYERIGDKKPESVEPAEILDLIDAMLAKGMIETARRVRQRLDAVFEHAALYHGFKTNPVALAKRELTKRFKMAKAANPEEHFPTVPVDEIPQLLRAMRAYVGTPVTRSLLWFIALTGCRTGEARGAKWTEFDLDAGTWNIPADRMKGRRAHRVYLAPAAVDLLRALDSRTRASPWVFPHPRRHDKPASENAVLFALAAIGYKDRQTGHGFRGMFSTLANESGLFRPDVIEAALAHKETDDVRGAYNQATYDAERKKLAHWYANELGRLEAGASAIVAAAS